MRISSSRPSADYEPDLITFVGRMDYYPNQQAVTTFLSRTCFPEIRRRAARHALRDRRGRSVARDPANSANLPGVVVTGSVPDVRPYVTRAALTVAPLEIARGTQNKILESMAMGVPVVCSRQAAVGWMRSPGEHLLAYDATAELRRVDHWNCSCRRRLATAWPVPGGPGS